MQVSVKHKPRGLRQRWMANSMSIVLVVTLIACGLFSASIATYYYSSMYNYWYFNYDVFN